MVRLVGPCVQLLLILLATVATGILGQEDEEKTRVIIGFPDAASRAQFIEDADDSSDLMIYRRSNAVSMSVPISQLQSLQSDRSGTYQYVEEDTQSFLYAETLPYGIIAVQGDLEGIPPPASSNAEDCFKVCVIDSGLHVGHPDIPYDLGDATLDGSEFGIPEGQLWYNPSLGKSHGTHVAGTILADGDNGQGVVGVIPNAEGICLLIARTFSDEQESQFDSFIDAAVEWCADQGARVINMSLGSSSLPSQASAKVFDDVWNEGVLVVAAAGNDGNGDKSYPASFETVVSVAAVDEDLDIASFSQFNDQINLSAPGVDVLSTVGSFAVSIAFDGNGQGEGELMQFSPPLDESSLNDLEFVDCQQAFVTCSNAEGRVCVIERGTTVFLDKARRCQDGGGVAAVIYNNLQGSFGGTLADASGLTIPVISIAREDGLTILNQVDTLSFALSEYSYSSFDGTSMASPHVAGVAAKIWAARPECTNEQVRDALYETALDLGGEGRDDDYGFGLVQAVDAYDYLLTLEEPCGVIPSSFTNAGTACTANFGTCGSNSGCCSNACQLTFALGAGAQSICRSAPKTGRTKLGGTRGAGGSARRRLVRGAKKTKHNRAYSRKKNVTL